jgi:hypothetical protein
MNKNSVEQKSAQSSESLASNAPDRNRRRGVLLGGGIGAILATVKSGSALAGGICVAPSAFSSIRANSATSNKPKSFGQCSSHGYYGNSGATDLDARWSPINRATATVSSAGFSGPGLWTADTKLFDIVKTGHNPLWKPDGNIIVVYLDVMTGRAGGVMTESDVKDLWNILFSTGSVNPKFSGWDAQTVRDFYKVWVGKASL